MAFLYDPSSNYNYRGIKGPWGRARNYLDTYAGQADANLAPESYYTHRLAQLGYGGLDNRSNIARGLYGRVSDAYGAARLKNNELKWTDYLNQVNFDELINGMSAQQRGENASNVVPYNVRWLPR